MRVFACIAIFFAILSGTVFRTGAQSKPKTGSIIGRISIDGKPVTRILVQLLEPDQDSSSHPPVLETATDADGRFQLNGLAAGDYRIIPLAPEYFIQDEAATEQPGRKISIKRGEVISDLHISLARGAVIAGRVTDPDGDPVIGGSVILSAFTKLGILEACFPTSFTAETDDRGIYRVYGVPPGRYVVGAKITIPGDSSKSKEAYFPNITNQSEAVPVEIAAGSEIENIDIAFRRPEKPSRTFKVTGRIVNAIDGKPVPNASLNYRGSSIETIIKVGLGKDLRTNIEGEFQINDIAQGSYIIYATPDIKNHSYSENVPFEIADSDVTDLEVKLYPGASISGTVVIKNTNAEEIQEKLQKMFFVISSTTQETEKIFDAVFRPEPDGSFKIAGLPPGKTEFRLTNHPIIYPGNAGFEILSIDRGTSEQKDEIDVSPGEQVTGVRIVLGYYPGTIRGQVIFEGVPPPPGTKVVITLIKAEEQKFHKRIGRDVDNLGRFSFENISAGNYKARLVFISDRPIPFSPIEQFVTVTQGQVTNLLFNVRPDLEEKRDDQPVTD